MRLAAENGIWLTNTMIPRSSNRVLGFSGSRPFGRPTLIRRILAPKRQITIINCDLTSYVSSRWSSSLRTVPFSCPRCSTARRRPRCPMFPASDCCSRQAWSLRVHHIVLQPLESRYARQPAHAHQEMLPVNHPTEGLAHTAVMLLLLLESWAAVHKSCKVIRKAPVMSMFKIAVWPT